MNKILLIAVLAASSIAMADKTSFAGSDTLGGAITDAIIGAHLDKQLEYVGGGSGVGEKNLVTGDQGIAPMSREMKSDVMNQLAAQGVKAVAHVIGLDGLSLYVKDNNPLASLDLTTIAGIFSCTITKWENVPNSGLRGEIRAYRRDDSSGTTDAFKHFTGVKNFGTCVKVMAETADIADVTSKDGMAIGYSGLSGHVAKNRPVAIAAKVGGTPVLPTTATIRNFSYPMARKLYVYEVTGARTANAGEKELINFVTDRSQMDPIMQQNEFITVD